MSAPPTREPPHAALVLALANTLDHETDTDLLTNADALARWLQEQQLLSSPASATPDDLAVALALRAGLRAAMAGHHVGAGDSPGPALEAVTSALPLRVTFGGAGPHLAPVDGGVRGALGRILVAVIDCRSDGSWQRLKLCPADDCRWGFYDASKNQTRVWCSMGVCGNRTKTRAYRARHRSDASRTPG